MQAMSNSTGYQGHPGNTASDRQMSMTGHYNSPHYGRSDFRVFSSPSSSSPQSYHPNTLQTFVNPSTSSVFPGHSNTDRSSGWQSSLPDQNMVRSSSTYPHNGQTSYGLQDAQRLQGHSRSGSVYSPVGHGSYGSCGAPYSDLTTTPSDRYGSPASPYPSGYPGYASPSFSHHHHTPSPNVSAPSSGDVCHWGPGRCPYPLEDSSPAGIARHLRQHHEVPVTDNRTRRVCAWGTRCGKDMFPSSFAKHIAECHLRNMTKQCQYCGADFARADTLSRHVKSFCPSASSPAGLLSQARAQAQVAHSGA